MPKRARSLVKKATSEDSKAERFSQLSATRLLNDNWKHKFFDYFILNSLRYIAQFTFIFLPPLRLPRTPRPITNPPRPQRQALQFQGRWLDISPEGYYADDHAHDISDVVTVPLYVAGAATVDTAVLVGFEGTAEGCGYKR